MRKVAQLGRRTFLMQVGKGSFAVLAEMTLGLGRRGLAVALGGSGLAAACQPIQRAAESGTIPPALEAVNYFPVFNQFVNAFVLVRGNEIAVVDTGIEGTAEMIGETITGAGLGWDAVGHLILTHYHQDHAGSMGDVLAAAANATAYAGEADISQLPVQTVQAVGDGDEVFGLQIIHTPGHTAGHICVLDPVGSLLIAGDALTNQEGTLALASPEFTANMEEAIASVQKLAALQFETLVVGHGEEIAGGASEAVAQLASTL
jgi:glyoxylase-like metal-dependent hydrolase (beta-lactamase superfamily II)